MVRLKTVLRTRYLLSFLVHKTLVKLFVDTARNIQAIAFFELSKPKHEQLLADAIHTAAKFIGKERNPEYHYFEGVTLEEIAVEIAVRNLLHLLRTVSDILPRIRW